MTRFCRFQLRTTNVEAARAFYGAVLGEGRAEIVPLPAPLVARGVPSHWIGHLGVEDVEGTARALVERGAARLGGSDVVILRDPGGALFALAAPPPEPTRADVVWHHLDTADLARSMALYQELFGWKLTERLHLGALGVHQQFAWEAGGVSVGSFTDVTGLRRHPQWVHHFRVAALDPALDAVRAAGGIVLGPVVEAGGDRIGICDDPQGAGFALRERRT